MCTSTCIETDFTGVVYYLHNGDFNPRYIGLTTQKPKDRLQAHKDNARAGVNRPVADWIRKHGYDNIHMCILETFDEDTIDLINDREMFHIAQYDTYFHNGNGGLNYTLGGEGTRGYNHTDETKSKMSVSRRGHSYNKGVKHSAEANAAKSERNKNMSQATKDKIGAAHKGRVSPMKGRVHSAETRAKMTAAHLGREFSEETRAKISAANKGKPSMGGHNRWHVNRGQVKAGCHFCENA